jgi:hypothetical protein
MAKWKKPCGGGGRCKRWSIATGDFKPKQEEVVQNYNCVLRKDEDKCSCSNLF